MSKFQDEPVVIASETKETLNLGNGDRGWPLLYSFSFLQMGCYSLGGGDVAWVGDLPVEQLTP